MINKNIKKILFSDPKKLSLEEKQKGFKVFAIFISIFCLIFLFLNYLSSPPKFEFHDIFLITSISFFVLILLTKVFREKSVKIVSIIFLFIVIIIMINYSNLIVSAIGWLALGGWLIYFIEEMIRLVKNS